MRSFSGLDAQAVTAMAVVRVVVRNDANLRGYWLPAGLGMWL
jgi:hypothetical protein